MWSRRCSLASGSAAERRAWAKALASIFRLFALDLDGARADADEALALEGGTDPWAAALSHLVLGWVDNVQGYFGQAVERCDRAVAIATGKRRSAVTVDVTAMR